MLLWSVYTSPLFCLFFRRGNNFLPSFCVPGGKGATKIESTIKRKSLLMGSELFHLRVDPYKL